MNVDSKSGILLHGGHFMSDYEDSMIGGARSLLDLTPFNIRDDQMEVEMEVPVVPIAPVGVPPPKPLITTQHHPKPEENMPFSCDLCSERFKKKLFLNNHMEKRHGIKYVFTEKGKKVKLVRMPEEMMEGERLDPCVEMLLQKNGINAKNVLGVQDVELNGAPQVPTAHEVDPTDLLNGRTEKQFGSGILCPKIELKGIEIAKERGETPYVTYMPYLSKKLYLLAIFDVTHDFQLLMPATKEDLEVSPNVKKHEEGEDKCETFEHVAVVAHVVQFKDSDSELGRLKFKLESPSSSLPIVSIMNREHFYRTILRTKPKRLRCLSIPPKPDPRTPEDPHVNAKRKYKRRAYTKRADKLEREKRKYRRRRFRRVESDDESEVSEGGSWEEEEEVVKTEEVVKKKRGRKPKVRTESEEREERERQKRKYRKRKRSSSQEESELENRLRRIKWCSESENFSDAETTKGSPSILKSHSMDEEVVGNPDHIANRSVIKTLPKKNRASSISPKKRRAAKLRAIKNKIENRAYDESTDEEIDVVKYDNSKGIKIRSLEELFDSQSQQETQPVVPKVKRGRGRPRKVVEKDPLDTTLETEAENPLI